MSYKNKTPCRKPNTSTPRRYNRRRDGVTTIPSTPDRHKLEEDRLKAQWSKARLKSLEEQ